MEIAQALGVELPTIVPLKPGPDDKRRRDGEGPSVEPRRIDGGIHEDRVVAAFKAADYAIQHTLGGVGEYGMNELTEVLSMLAIRYGCDSLKAVRVTFKQGMLTVPNVALAVEKSALRDGEARV